MTDAVTQAYLKQQRLEGLALAEASDILGLRPEPGECPQHYHAEFACRGLVKSPSGEIVEANRFGVHISLRSDILRRAEAPEVLTWLGPPNTFHPNIRAPYICVGRIYPGPSIVDLLFQVYEIIVYWKFNPREDDALNKEACSWARNHQDRFPIDRRPLKRLVPVTTGAAPEGGV